MNLIRQFIESFTHSRPFAAERQSYIRLKDRGLAPDGIIDVGAYEGEWARMASSVWPNIPVLMIEPQSAKKNHLDQVCLELSEARYLQTVLSSKRDELVTFYEMETGSSFYSENSNAPRLARELTTNTLDDVADNFPGSALFLKIDVQGAELDVLAGGKQTLQRVAAIQLELPIVNYNAGAPSFQEAIAVMSDLGYAPIELANQTILQGVMAQIDIVFAKEGDPIRNFRFNF